MEREIVSYEDVEISKPGDPSTGADGSDTQDKRWNGSNGFAGGNFNPFTQSGGRQTEASRHLWIGSIDESVLNEDRLKEVFGEFGEVEFVKIFFGKSYGFVDFKHLYEAVKAMKEMRNKPFGAMRLQIRFGKAESSTTLWIEINDDITSEELSGFFKKYGNIENITIHRKNNYALIQYSNESSAVDAIESNLEGANVSGHVLKVDYQLPPSEKKTKQSDGSAPNRPEKRKRDDFERKRPPEDFDRRRIDEFDRKRGEDFEGPPALPTGPAFQASPSFSRSRDNRDSRDTRDTRETRGPPRDWHPHDDFPRRGDYHSGNGRPPSPGRYPEYRRQPFGYSPPPHYAGGPFRRSPPRDRRYSPFGREREGHREDFKGRRERSPGPYRNERPGTYYGRRDRSLSPRRRSPPRSPNRPELSPNRPDFSANPPDRSHRDRDRSHASSSSSSTPSSYPTNGPSNITPPNLQTSLPTSSIVPNLTAPNLSAIAASLPSITSETPSSYLQQNNILQSLAQLSKPAAISPASTLSFVASLLSASALPTNHSPTGTPPVPFSGTSGTSAITGTSVSPISGPKIVELASAVITPSKDPRLRPAAATSQPSTPPSNIASPTSDVAPSNATAPNAISNIAATSSNISSTAISAPPVPSFSTVQTSNISASQVTSPLPSTSNSLPSTTLASTPANISTPPPSISTPVSSISAPANILQPASSALAPKVAEAPKVTAVPSKVADSPKMTQASSKVDASGVPKKAASKKAIPPAKAAKESPEISDSKKAVASGSSKKAGKAPIKKAKVAVKKVNVDVTESPKNFRKGPKEDDLATLLHGTAPPTPVAAEENSESTPPLLLPPKKMFGNPKKQRLLAGYSGNEA
eukprot:TRINITY_DN7185_c0_g1_i1.p1 TRINITY_DN7185_c0_g1~~TRINITY_DN7185_c0_g1_i1.p1  ORF type:complete len:866 (-),score=210.61 TRINITY_DN7185_c0_g1_i1:33-2630(-)